MITCSKYPDLVTLLVVKIHLYAILQKDFSVIQHQIFACINQKYFLLFYINLKWFFIKDVTRPIIIGTRRLKIVVYFINQ